jgi:Animal haem peroxidase
MRLFGGRRTAVDLDLYTAILAENPLPEGLLGPVGSCIISDQFARLKRGDRFWYETPDRSLRFTHGTFHSSWHLVPMPKMSTMPPTWMLPFI